MSLNDSGSGVRHSNTGSNTNNGNGQHRILLRIAPGGHNSPYGLGGHEGGHRVIPVYELDVQALKDGFWNGFLPAFIAGGAGWGIRIMFKLFRTITGG